MREIIPARRPTLSAALALAVALTPVVAQAHPGHDATPGFLAGFQHPWTGLDHLLLMLASGMMAFRLRERPVLVLPFALLALFSLIHGYAHAAATPNYFARPAYTAGFAMSMLAICLLGVAIAARFPRRPMLVLGAGASCAVTGFALLSLN